MPKVNFKPSLDDTPLTFGTHKGKTPNQVAKEAPSYILWMSEKIKPCPCSHGLILDCESAINDRDPNFDDEPEGWARDES